ncbi:nucleotidyltransferase family protein [Hyphococcus sp.]|uniref:nucleotidyltransferase family protein n=1 Tax=Hyphococcus sp. TaxID=2038636 RepID=UPI0035C77E2B
MKPIPLTLQTTYQDLLQAHLDRAPADMAGSPHLRKSDRKAFWYATVRAPGGAHQQYFIGPDDEKTRARIEQWKTAQTDARNFRTNASEKAAALRAARLPALDMTTGKALRAFAMAGAFRLGGVLVGTHAFRLYDLELGARLADGATAITADLDLASFEKLSLAVDDHAEPALPVVLKSLGMSPIGSLNPKKPTRWRMPDSDFTIDFLAPSFDDREGPQKLEALGVWAQGLHFLNFLIRDPIPAVALYREGVLVQIPRPERFAVHKLIVAARRRGPGRSKAQKDLQQARALMTALAEMRPYELSAAYEEARQHGDAWRNAIDMSLERDPDLKKLVEDIA